MQKLQTVNADTLLYEPLEKPSFVVEGLIPTGLTLFCGSQKIGMERLKKYFPKGTTPKQMEDTIIRLLERELQRKRGRDSR